MMIKRILVDAREFVKARFTGIGRVLEGVVEALDGSYLDLNIVLATSSEGSIPSKFQNKNKISIIKIPSNFLESEKTLSDLSRKDFRLYISPYPKLPLFGIHCKSIHTIHDVLDLTHPAYKKRLGVFFDKFRLKSALKRASLTWYDSLWSKKETLKYAGLSGKNPKVRYPGIDELFSTKNKGGKENILNKYKIELGYILVLGNGNYHKNLGVLLNIARKITRQIVFVGVSKKKREYWQSRYKPGKTVWIKHVVEEDLPSVIRNAFCLAQPTTAEGYGYPPLEAMACGVPAVVSNIPVLVETTGGNAIIADPKNSNDWVMAFEALEDRAVYLKQVGEGLKWVEPLRGRKGWEKHISDIEELIGRS